MTDHGKWQDDVEAWQEFYSRNSPDPAPVRVAYDPVPDLAELLAGLGRVTQRSSYGVTQVLGDLLRGPYARLRAGLVVDDPPSAGLANIERALREALK